MPQLDPGPWFLILITSWVIFLIMTPVKVTNHQLLNDPALKTTKGLSKTWTWPWP